MICMIPWFLICWVGWGYISMVGWSLHLIGQDPFMQNVFTIFAKCISNFCIGISNFCKTCFKFLQNVFPIFAKVFPTFANFTSIFCKMYFQYDELDKSRWLVRMLLCKMYFATFAKVFPILCKMDIHILQNVFPICWVGQITMVGWSLHLIGQDQFFLRQPRFLPLEDGGQESENDLEHWN